MGSKTALPLPTAHSRRVVGGLHLVGGKKNRGGVLENGMVDAVCPPPRFLYRPPHPRRAGDGSLLVGGRTLSVNVNVRRT